MRLLIYGARDYAATVADLARDCGHDVVGMIEDGAPRDGVVGCFDDVATGFADCGIVLGIGYNNLPGRWAAWRRVLTTGRPTPSLVHPRAYVARSAAVGRGSVVMAGAIVDRASRLGEATVVWPGVCINHDCQIGDNTFVSPSAVLCGFVRVGAHSFIGAGAAIADHCQLPESSFLRLQERYTANRPT